jgi:hypothetical protein
MTANKDNGPLDALIVGEQQSGTFSSLASYRGQYVCIQVLISAFSQLG